MQVDAGRVATAGDDAIAIIWHTDTVRQAGTLKGHTRAITSMVVVPATADSPSVGSTSSANPLRRIITGSVDKTIKIWCIEDCTLLTSLTESDHAALCLLPLHNTLFCSAGQGVCLWNTAGKMITKYTSPVEDAEDVQDLILVSRSRMVASSNDKKLIVYDITGLDTIEDGRSSTGSSEDTANDAGNGINGSSGGGGGKSQDGEDGDGGDHSKQTAVTSSAAPASLPLIKVGGTLDKHREDVCCIHKINDAEFASGSLDGTIVIWSSTTLHEIRILNFKPIYQSPKTHKYVFSIQHLISFKDYLVAAMGDGFVVYNKDTGKELACVRQAHRTVVTHLLMMDEAEWLITCSADAVIRLWGLAGIVHRGGASGVGGGDGSGLAFADGGGGGGGGVAGFFDSIKLPKSPLKGGGSATSVKITGAPTSASPSLFRRSKTPPRPAGTSSPSVFQKASAAPRRFSGKSEPAEPRLLGNLAAHSGRVNMLLPCGGSQFLSCGSDQLVVLWRTDVVEWGRRNDISRSLLKP